MNILNTPISVKHLELRNRLVLPPMATSMAESDGLVTQKLLEYYDEKSKGGYLGLIITEHSYISPEGKASNGQLSIADDSVLDGFKSLTDVIHGNHCKAMAQISHAGGKTERKITGHEPLSASASGRLMAKEDGALPKEMGEADIQKVIHDFAAAAVRVKEAGFDGVEIHSAHGYLLNQFFSPLTNRRCDRYSGHTLCGRYQLHLEVIEAVREAVGEDFPIALRLGACDYMDGGSSIADSVIAARKFEEAGVDLLDISGGFCSYRKPDATEQGYFSEITQEVKKNVSIPVLLTGGIVDADAAEDLLRHRKADLIGVGRAILKDSNWAKKAITGTK